MQKKDGAIFTLKSDEGENAKASIPYLGSAISIAEFLESVKNVNLANSVLSKDVLQNLGAVRVKNEFDTSLRYALTGDEHIDAIFGDIDMSADENGNTFDIEAILERGLPRKPGASTLTVGAMKKPLCIPYIHKAVGLYRFYCKRSYIFFCQCFTGMLCFGLVFKDTEDTRTASAHQGIFSTELCKPCLYH